MKQILVVAIVLFGAVVVGCNSQANTVERTKREYGGYGHDNYGYEKGHDKGYGGYRDDGYHDDGYGHEHHGYGYGTTKRSRSRLGLLALLPLLILPAAAAFGIPILAALTGATQALIPVTTTLGTITAGNGIGRKKREAIYKEIHTHSPKLAKSLREAETIANYLENMNVKVDLQDDLMYNHLACSGLLDRANECLQRLACEFSDPTNQGIPELEKQVSAIVLNNILTNKKIVPEVKTEIRRAGQYGRVFSGKCHKFSCSVSQQHKLYKSFAS